MRSKLLLCVRVLRFMDSQRLHAWVFDVYSVALRQQRPIMNLPSQHKISMLFARHKHGSVAAARK